MSALTTSKDTSSSTLSFAKDTLCELGRFLIRMSLTSSRVRVSKILTPPTSFKILPASEYGNRFTTIPSFSIRNFTASKIPNAISLLEIILLDKRATALPRYGVDTKKSIR